jgi:uncharacterized protein YgfB (UPF0149 family)
MNKSPDMPEYDRFDQALESIGVDIGASEAHGLLCGLLSAGASEAHVEWMEGLFADRPSNDLLVREARQMFGQLYLASREKLADEELDFGLLLPDEDDALKTRAKALVKWCEGYLFGLGLAGISEQHLVGDAKEALNDISEFTRMDLEAIDEDEAAETAYMELQEFLRVATLLIWEELAGGREDKKTT